ncbi:uncharacterized protein PRCAT00001794001 [Priceomyces carsonii]|uniref:uncharacterized protein n=1 Tax=Priceomyces carsonii TaxID=28549 RepID=UPI002EDB47AB|nr:unnamed protein product [Priceomyces carsonii]
MAQLTEFEKQRQQNIQRNKELLRKLNLDSLGNSFVDDRSKKPKHPAKRRKRNESRLPSKEHHEPTRRSSRLAGIKTENSEEYKKHQEELEEADRRKKEIDKLRLTRLYGNFKLIDLITDRKLGGLKFEDKVIKTEGDVKKEGTPLLEDNEKDINIADDNKVLGILKELGGKFSTGDFYDIIRKNPLECNDSLLESKRKEFDDLKIYGRFDPLDIKITHNRITAINFHPTETDRIISAGDTSGHLGIWAVDSSKDEEWPLITILKPHGRNISRVLTSSKSPSKIFSSSYDGSVRQLDLNKLESSETVYLSDPYESNDYPLGVSDIMFPLDNPNLLYMTTLTGNFYRHDLRTAFKFTEKASLLRLHDKKIGSFSINPNVSYQISSASLDRTLRIWDLRNVSKSNGTWSEFEDQKSPLICDSYSSRLSISCVDWSSSNKLVCNGYDDTINLFDLNDSIMTNSSKDLLKNSKLQLKEDPDSSLIPNSLKPFNRIKHNCQTGRWVSILKSKWQSLPNDGIQKFVIANMNRGLDVYDDNGSILAHLTDPEKLGAVPAVSTLHPSKNWVVGGSASGKLYLFE